MISGNDRFGAQVRENRKRPPPPPPPSPLIARSLVSREPARRRRCVTPAITPRRPFHYRGRTNDSLLCALHGFIIIIIITPIAIRATMRCRAKRRDGPWADGRADGRGQKARAKRGKRRKVKGLLYKRRHPKSLATTAQAVQLDTTSSSPLRRRPSVSRSYAPVRRLGRRYRREHKYASTEQNIIIVSHRIRFVQCANRWPDTITVRVTPHSLSDDRVTVVAVTVVGAVVRGVRGATVVVRLERQQ